MNSKSLYNIFSNIAVPFLRLSVALVMSPLIVKALGDYDYGIWEIVISVIGYMGLLDLGLQPAIVRYVANYKAVDDRVRLSVLYSSVLFLLTFLGLLVFLFFVLWALIKPEILASNDLGITKYSAFILIIAFQVLVSFVGKVFESFHEGFQNFYQKNLIQIATFLIGNVVIFILLSRGFGLLTLALGNTIGISVKFTAFYLLLKNDKSNRLYFNIKNIKIEEIKKLLAFGFKSMAQGLAAQISNNTDSIVIGSILGPVYVTIYVIPTKLINYFRVIIYAVTKVLFPKYAELDAIGYKEQIKRIYLLSSKYVIGILTPVYLSLFFLGLPFISIWIGAEYADKGKYVFYIFYVFMFIYLLNPFYNGLFTAKAKQGYLAKLMMIEALFNILLSLVLIRCFGIEGVAMGTLIPTLIIKGFILSKTCKILYISIVEYIRIALIPIILPAFLSFFSLYFLTTKFLLSNYFNLITIFMIIQIIYFVLFYFITLDKNERSDLSILFNKVLSKVIS